MARIVKTIGLLDHAGGGNLGDDATLDAVLCSIKARWPNATLVAFSMNPDDTRKRHGITSYPIGQWTWQLGSKPAGGSNSRKDRIKTSLCKSPLVFKLLKLLHTAAVKIPRVVLREFLFLAKSFRTLLSLDFLIISGGGQLTDFWAGPWAFPYAIFKWSLIARCARVKVIVLNVGAGPLLLPISKQFIKRALLVADYVSFRDEESRALVRDIGFKRKSQVFPDNVYSLVDPVFNQPARGYRLKAVVGLAPMPYCDPRSYYPQKNQATYDSFIQRFADFGSWLVKSQYQPTLFCSDIGVDPSAIEDLQTTLQQRNKISITAPRVTSICELLEAMSEMDYVITCRFHGVVFAHLLKKPVIALSHHPKVARLMADLGLSDYCLDISRFDASMLERIFTSLVQNREAITMRMAERLAQYRNKLTGQFDELFPRENGFVIPGKLNPVVSYPRSAKSNAR